MAMVIPVIFIVSVYSGAFGHLQTREELLYFRNATATLVLSSENQLIGKIFYENRTKIGYSQLPESLIHALIATEDSRFYEHKGIDSRSLIRVLFKSILLNISSVFFKLAGLTTKLSFAFLKDLISP